MYPNFPEPVEAATSLMFSISLEPMEEAAIFSFDPLEQVGVAGFRVGESRW